MADLDEAFKRVCDKFEMTELSSQQKEAIEVFINRNQDIFVNLPTGCGKSLIYQALPVCFDVLYTDVQHIVVVVSPLINLMKDQVSKLQKLGVSAISLTEISEQDAKSVEQGSFSIVYGMPASWLNNERWRSVLWSEIYSSKLCSIAVDEAHVIKQW